MLASLSLRCVLDDSCVHLNQLAGMSKASDAEERCRGNGSREPLLNASPGPCEVFLLADDVDDKALNVVRREAVDGEQRVQIVQALLGLSERVHDPH